MEKEAKLIQMRSYLLESWNEGGMNYMVKADDEDEHTDEATVDILETAPTPTPPPVVTPTPSAP